MKLILRSFIIFILTLLVVGCPSPTDSPLPPASQYSDDTWYVDILQTGAQGGTITYARIREAALQQGVDLTDVSNETLDIWFDGEGDEANTGYCIDIYVSSTAAQSQWDGPGNKIPHWWEEEATDSNIHGYAAQYRQHWCSGAGSIDLKGGAAYTLMLRIVKFR